MQPIPSDCDRRKGYRRDAAHRGAAPCCARGYSRGGVLLRGAPDGVPRSADGRPSRTRAFGSACTARPDPFGRIHRTIQRTNQTNKLQSSGLLPCVLRHAPRFALRISCCSRDTLIGHAQRRLPACHAVAIRRGAPPWKSGARAATICFAAQGRRVSSVRFGRAQRRPRLRRQQLAVDEVAAVPPEQVHRQLVRLELRPRPELFHRVRLRLNE